MGRYINEQIKEKDKTIAELKAIADQLIVDNLNMQMQLDAIIESSLEV